MRKIFTLYFILALLVFSCEQGPYKKAMDLNKIGTELFLSNNDSALFYFKEAIKTDSTFQPAIQNKANYLIKHHRYEEAIHAIDLLIHQKPYPEAWQMKGVLQDILLDTVAAKISYENAIKEFNKRYSNSNKEQNTKNNLALAIPYYLIGDTAKAKNLLLEYKNEEEVIDLADSILNNLDNKSKILQLLLK